MRKLSFLLILILVSTLLSGCFSRQASSIGIIGGADGPTSIFVTDSNGETSVITSEDAEAIALSHAGLTAEQIDRISSKLDPDDGILQYDVEIRVGQTEYDYEIDAVTGEILSFEQDN